MSDSPAARLAVFDVGLAVGERTLFKNINLSVSAGAAVALMGPSGSGKTSLLNAIAGLFPCTGRIDIDGQNVSGLSPSDRDALRLEQIGMVFQDSDLLPELTVRENAELPGRLTGVHKDAYTARAMETLAEVGMADRCDSWPSDLSGGERQRVAVARALHHRPALLLADEPTGALDVANRDRVTQLLVDVARDQGAVLVVATHDPAVAQRCDVVYLCQSAGLVRNDDAAA